MSLFGLTDNCKDASSKRALKCSEKANLPGSFASLAVFPQPDGVADQLFVLGNPEDEPEGLHFCYFHCSSLAYTCAVGIGKIGNRVTIGGKNMPD